MKEFNKLFLNFTNVKTKKIRSTAYYNYKAYISDFDNDLNRRYKEKV